MTIPATLIPILAPVIRDLIIEARNSGKDPSQERIRAVLESLNQSNDAVQSRRSK